MSNSINPINIAEPPKRNYVRNGAIIGGAAGAVASGFILPKALSRSSLTMKSFDHFVRSGITNAPDLALRPKVSKFFNSSKVLRLLTSSAILNLPTLLFAGVGAGIGLIAKACAKKADK